MLSNPLENAKLLSVFRDNLLEVLRGLRLVVFLAEVYVKF